MVHNLISKRKPLIFPRGILEVHRIAFENDLLISVFQIIIEITTIRIGIRIRIIIK